MKKLLITLVSVLIGVNPAFANSTPYQRFLQVRDGMTMSQVESTLGVKCFLQSETSFLNVTSRMWDCPMFPSTSFSPSVMIMTQNGMVFTKSQFGLQ